MYDICIIGGGPAGLSAALTANRRSKSCLVISSAPENSLLYKAEQVDNYLGLPQISGKELLETFESHVKSLDIEIKTGVVTAVMPYGESFGVAVGSDFFEAKSIIIGIGVSRAKPYPGEDEFLGLGVSYCATCDGMLYRGKKVAVIGLSTEAHEEAEFLRSINCELEFFDSKRAKKFEIVGSEKLEALIADGVRYEVEAVFILRPSVAPDKLLPDLEFSGADIAVGKDMSTNLPGVFAAGDCVGLPYQIGKAVGEGNVAALSAVKYLDSIK